MNLENGLLSDKSQSQKDKYCIIPFILDILSMSIHRNRKLNGIFQGLKEEKLGSCSMGKELQFCEMEMF